MKLQKQNFNLSFDSFKFLSFFYVLFAKKFTLEADVGIRQITASS